MALREGGWPLGLRRLSVRIGLRRSGDFSGSMSFSTLLSASPTSSAGSSSSSSSDSDTEPFSGSFRDGGATTLGRLMELSRGSFRGSRGEQLPAGGRRRPSTWLLLSPCTRAAAAAAGDDGEPCGGGGRTPSLGHFLQAERRAGSGYRRSQPDPGPSLFSNGGEAAPPGKRRRLSCMGVVLCGDCRR